MAYTYYLVKHRYCIKVRSCSLFYQAGEKQEESLVPPMYNYFT